MKLKFLCSALLAALVYALSLPAASADDYPSKPVTIVVPFAPGGATDVLPRLFAARLQAELGQPVVIENVGGAGGTIGLARVARGARRLHHRLRQLDHVRVQRRDHEDVL